MDPNTMLEATMLICLGASWPLRTLRLLRTRRVDGCGLLPSTLVFCGYLAGMSAKVLCACGGGGLAPIFWLYVLNAGSVGVNIALQWHFSRPGRPQTPGAATT